MNIIIQLLLFFNHININMNYNLRSNNFFQKIKSKIENLFISRQIFEKEVMKLHFEKFKKRKIIYDIRRKNFTFSFKSKDDTYKYLFLLLMLLSAFFLPYFSTDVGISSREWNSVQAAEDVYQYYTQGDMSIHQNDYLKTHGQSIDNLVYFIQQWIGGSDNPFFLYHIFSALFGWGIILITGFFLVRLFSWRGAFFGLLFLLVSPRFLGHIMGNLTDTSFAFAYLLFFYHLYLLNEELPSIKWKRIIYITFSILLATSIHSGGYLLLFFLFLFSILYYLLYNPIKKIFTLPYFINLLKLLIVIGSISIVVYIFDAVYLPYSFWSTYVNPLDALSVMTENITSVEQLFEGKLITSENTPSYYLLKYFFITTPFIIIIGFILFFIVLKTAIKKTSGFQCFLLFFALFYPLIYITNKSLNAYEDFAQHLFLYPFIILLAVSGFESLLIKINDKYTNPVIIGFMFFLSLMPLRHIIVNHPLEAIYFNEISGGVPNSYGNYEMDAQNISNKMGWETFAHYFRNEAVREHKQIDKLVVCTDGEPALQIFQTKDSAFVQLEFCRYEDRYNYDWDYFISFGKGLPAYQYLYGIWPPTNSFQTISIEGKPIIAFIKNDDKPIN